MLEHQTGPSPQEMEGLCCAGPWTLCVTHWHLLHLSPSPLMSHAPLQPSKVLGSRTQLQEKLVEIPSPSLAGKGQLWFKQGQGKWLQCCDTCGILIAWLSLICVWSQHLLCAVSDDGQKMTGFRQINSYQQGCSSLLLMFLSAPFFPASPLQVHPKDSSPNIPNFGMDSVSSICFVRWREGCRITRGCCHPAPSHCPALH